MITNFNLPYFATNPQDLWRRWHISLSTWMRDYLYIPLGGNQGNLAMVFRNLMVTMLLGGLWHGAAWNYVLWGAYHGILLCIYHAWRQLGNHKRPSYASSRLLATILMFVFVCYGWLLFRAQSFAQIAGLTSTLFTDFGNLNYGGGVPRLSAILGLALLVPMEFTQHMRHDDPHYYRCFPAPLRGFLIAAMIAITLMGTSNEPAQFIYFQF
jgi:D-alanyl-lipoteichoic acid acyltransferase DltB (MBOAT superfamily)